jgi:hypothetical protein
MAKNRLPDPSEICALDFKQEFPRFSNLPVPATIGINRSIFPNASSIRSELSPGKKTVTAPTPLTLQRSDALAALPAKPPEPHRHSSPLSPSRISVSIGRFS